ncbi:hypothetical protein CPB83DRAFT_856279 [Crepidotus variabilis]|uniref:Smr domain-containing protein n=1 Tax=Crepidotus variabilis TaxID=179855 RepID=A0A9P6EEF2_9AGAR|nr:hypothetical protein CPB83DRAFT_856279 [Crepidotus variabilis]
MDVALSILAGLGLRLVLTPNVFDSDVGPPAPNNLVTGLLGVWEGVVVHQVAGRSTSAIVDHFLAYGLRLLIDFVVTKNPQRLIVVLLCSGLSAFVSEAIIPYDELQSELTKGRSREKERRHRRTRSTQAVAVPVTAALPPRIRAFKHPSRNQQAITSTPAPLPPLPPHSTTTLHFPPPTPPSFFLQDKELSDVFSPAPLPSKQAAQVQVILEKPKDESTPQPEDPLAVRPHSGVASILETTEESGSPLPVLMPLPTPPESAQSAVPSSDGPVDISKDMDPTTPVTSSKRFDNQLYTIPEVSSPETDTINGQQQAQAQPLHVPPPLSTPRARPPFTPEPLVQTPLAAAPEAPYLSFSPPSAPLPVPNVGMRRNSSGPSNISRWLASQSQSQSQNPDNNATMPAPQPPYATSATAANTIFANPFSPTSPDLDTGVALPVQLKGTRQPQESTPPPPNRSRVVARGRGQERARSRSRSKSRSRSRSVSQSRAISTFQSRSRSGSRTPSPRYDDPYVDSDVLRENGFVQNDPPEVDGSVISSGMESDPLRTPPTSRVVPTLKGKKKASTKTLKGKGKKGANAPRLDTDTEYDTAAYPDDPLMTPHSLRPQSQVPEPELELDDEGAVLSPLPLEVRSIPSRGPTPGSHDESSATEVGPSRRPVIKNTATTTNITSTAPMAIPQPRRAQIDDDSPIPGSLSLPLSQNMLLQPPQPPSGPLFRRSIPSPTISRSPSPPPQRAESPAPPSPGTVNSGLSDISTFSTRVPDKLYTRGDDFRQLAKEKENTRAAIDEERRRAEMEGRSLDAVNLRIKLRDLEAEVQKLHEKAARRYYAARNTLDISNKIDVHGLRPREAFDRIERAIVKASTEGKSVIRVIVGKGLHSVNQIPTLKPAVMREMQRLQFPCEVDERNPGVLNITIPKAQTPS